MPRGARPIKMYSVNELPDHKPRPQSGHSRATYRRVFVIFFSICRVGCTEQISSAVTCILIVPASDLGYTSDEPTEVSLSSAIPPIPSYRPR